jgi:hypothetical protein
MLRCNPPSMNGSRMPRFNRLTRFRAIATFLFLIVAGSLWLLSWSLDQMTIKTLFKSEPTINSNIVTVSFHHLDCENPSLPRGSIHIVVAGYKYNQDDSQVFDLGPTITSLTRD